MSIDGGDDEERRVLDFVLLADLIFDRVRVGLALLAFRVFLLAEFATNARRRVAIHEILGLFFL